MADLAEATALASESAHPRNEAGSRRRRHHEAAGHVALERSAAMALQRTAFNDKVSLWMESGRHNITLLTEEAWRTAKRDVLAWESMSTAERVLLMLKAKLQVVTATKELWPGCTMVTGRPRHSPSNGGSERFNRTIEEKVPCVAVFGQVPRVGLQSLRLNDDLANSLTTEADLNAAMGLPQDKAIDDDSPAASEPVAEDVAAPPTDGLAADLASPAASEPMAEDAAAPPTDGLAAEFASPAASEPMAEDAAAPPTDGLAAEFASPAASEPMAEDAAAPPTDGLAAEFASPAASEPMAEDAAAPPTDGLAAEFASPAASEPMAEDAAAPPTDGLAAEFASPAASEPMAEDATAPPTDGLAAEFASPAASEPMYGIGCSSPAH
eukprot:jgi/Tetstr1/431845/TSEL_021337.t1